MSFSSWVPATPGYYYCWSCCSALGGTRPREDICPKCKKPLDLVSEKTKKGKKND